MNKKLKSLIVIFLIVLFIFLLGTASRTLLLRLVKNKVKGTLSYARLRLSAFPPSLVMEDVRTISPSPFFSAKKIAVNITYKSLLSKENPINVFIDEPVLIVHSTPSGGKKGSGQKFFFPFPFSVERGLIRGGEFYFWGETSNFHSSGIKALFTQKKDYISFQGEAEDNVFSPGSSRKELQGKVSLFIEGRGEKINIKKLKIYGSDFVVIASGILSGFPDHEISLKAFLKVNVSSVVDFLDLPFELEGGAEGEGVFTQKKGEISFSSDVFSRNLLLNKVPLGNVRSRIEVSKGPRATVEFNIQKRSLQREYVKIQVKGRRIEGVVRGFHLDPVIKFAGIPWPIKSPVWGNFVISEDKLKADVEFRDNSFDAFSDRFPFQGKVRFIWNRKDEFSFSSPELLSSFARVEVNGKVKVNKELEIDIRGDVSNVKQARKFTSLILTKEFTFPEIRGTGKVNLRIFGSYVYPQVKVDFFLSPGGFAKFQASSVEGIAELVRNDFTARFRVEDPSMEGEINLLSNQEGTITDVHINRGKIEKILPALDIHLPLQGNASGVFNIRQKSDDILVDGTFSSAEVKIFNQHLSDVKGRLYWEKDVLSFPELQFSLYEGEVRGNALVNLLSQEFDVDVQGKKIDLSSLYSLVRGDVSFGLRGRGLLGKDRASGKFEIRNLFYSPFQTIDVQGELKLGFSGKSLLLDLKGSIFPGENEFNMSINVPFDEKPFSMNLKGTFRNLDLFLPWKGAKGQIDYLAEAKEAGGSLQLKGVIDFKGSVLPFPRFAHAVRDYSGLIFVEDSTLSVRSFKGKMGGGDVWGSGKVELDAGGGWKSNLKIEGKNLLLSPLERARVLTDGWLNLVKERERFQLTGDFDVKKLYWRRELDEKFVFYSSPHYRSGPEPGIFDNLTLNIHLRADDNAWMENSLGKIEGRFDLTVSGNVKAPILTGDIEALKGNVYFQDRKFRILKGRVSFINPLIIEPYLEFKGETYVKDYRVTFSLSGLLGRLNPEFSSSPPLPPEDVLALLAMGEAFKRTYSYDRSTQLSTASLLSFQLAEEAKKRAESLFHIDRFRIDPFVMGSSAETTARLTVGKRISRNFFILYSTNLSTQREELVRLEWELTDDLSVVGIRNEIGRFSIDVKIHKRF